MRQYDRYPYNDDYNGNSVFERKSSSSGGGDLGGVIALALIVGGLFGGAYLMETYPTISWIVCFGGVALNIYIFYRIIKFAIRSIRKIFRCKKSSQKTVGKRMF